MTRRPVHLTLSVVAYAGFALVVVWTVAFLAGVAVPTTVDAPIRSAPGPSVAIDVGLVLLFAVQHSVMARSPVKRALRRWVPRELQRAVFVVATVVCLVLLLTLWHPVAGWVWEVDGPAAFALWTVCAGGWALALVSTFVVDHLEFTGLRQAGWRNPPGTGAPPRFVQNGLYGLVRHPMMAGLLVAFWCTPRMSVGHIVFASAASLYIAVGVRLEERDLGHEIGPAYRRYAARVPALVPRVRHRADGRSHGGIRVDGQRGRRRAPGQGSY